MNNRKLQGRIYFASCMALLLFTIYYHAWQGSIVAGFCIAMGILVIIFPNTTVNDNDNNDSAYEAPPSKINTKTKVLTYYGDELKFAESDIISVLIKHLPYYAGLNEENQQKFIKRLVKFIDDKTFKIHDKSGFREMPMLISATAIQFSFGLDKYLLPNFTDINIYPVEFISLTPSIRFLEGNVSGNNINISCGGNYKRFLFFKIFFLPS